MKRILARTALALLALLLVAAAATVGWLYTSLPKTAGTVEIAGPTAPIDIVRDARGVPHIFAQGETDAWFALGYVHAQDRLWQMELMRRLGAGRLAEIVGERGLQSDRFMRVLGLNHAVEEQWGGLDAPTRAAFEAYAAGVNAWLDGRSGALPIEFLLLRHSPEPWRPTDSLLWAKLMGMRLSGNWRTELFRARLLRSLPPDRVAELWPPYPGDAPVTVAAAPDIGGLDLERLAAALPPETTPELSPGGSNAWAVAGSGTAGGKPVLANDPHLGFSAPILWYLARVETPGFAVAGATVPGVPFVVLGHNRRLAWGLTTTEADLQDLFIERTATGDAAAYDTPEGPRPYVVREERIAIAGQPDEVLKVRRSRHGPVLSDVLGGPSSRAMALSATYLLPGDRTPQALRSLNLATTWPGVVAAMRDFHAPQQNLMVAVDDGTIGFIAPGRVPIRRSGTGGSPSPGWTGEADWTGYVPFDDLPRAVDPPSGRLVNANNRIVPADYPYFISQDWAPPYRAQRIDALLDAGGSRDAAAAAGLQQDAVSPAVADLMPLLAAVEPGSAAAARALALLRAWDGDFDRDRPEPLIFTAWMRELTRRIFADELGDDFPDFWSFRPLLLKSVLGGGRDHWCDDVRTQRTEACAGIAAAALSSVVAELAETFKRDMAEWRWGGEHPAIFDHPTLGGLPLVGGWANLLVEADGGDETVNRGGVRFDDSAAPYASIHGAGFRGVYDLADLDAARLMIATGQSGNPLSRHYGDLLEDWRDGRALNLGGPRAEVTAAGGTLRLVPTGR